MRTTLVSTLLATFIVLSGLALAQPTANVAGESGIAVGGYDPVALFQSKKPVNGDSAHRATHEGATYLFANAENRKSFEAAPEKYAPQFGGYCAYGVSLGALLPVDIDTVAVIDGKLYLNLNPEVAKAFAKDQKAIIAKAETQWKTLAAKTTKPNLPRNVNVAGASNIAVGGYDLVAFFTAKKATPGDPKITHAHAGATYAFATEENRAAFAKAPEKYLPQYGGYCAIGMAFDALFPVDIDTWVIENGKLYLNKSPEIARMFAKDRGDWIEKAEANWAKRAAKPRGNN